MTNVMTIEYPLMVGNGHPEMFNLTQPKLITMKQEKRLFELDFMDNRSPTGLRNDFKSPGGNKSPASIKKSPSNAPRFNKPILFNIETNLQSQINSIIITD